MSKRLTGLILASLLVASCTIPPSSSLRATSTLKLSLAGLYPAERQVQYLAAGGKARVTVTGPGLAQAMTTTAPISGASLVATLTGIPAGPNRVIDVEALDDNGAPIPGGRFRTSVTLQEGANSALISPATTPRGDVLAKLHADGSALALTLDANRLQEKIEAIHRTQRVQHFGLIDGVAIANALTGNGGDLDKLGAGDATFVQQATSLQVTIAGLPQNLQAEVWVDDPVSPKQSGVSNGGLAISPIKPGSWKLYGRAGTMRVGPIPVDPAPQVKVTLNFSQGFHLVQAMPEPRGGSATGLMTLAQGERMVVAGGVVGSGATPLATNSVKAFDGTQWTTLPPMPVAVSHPAFTVHDNSLYVLGGRGIDGLPVKTVQIFDGATGAWRSDIDLKYASMLGSAAVINGTLYLTGGRYRLSSGDTGSDWSIYWIPLAGQTRKWEELGNEPGEPTLNSSRYGAATTVIAGKLFVMSGAYEYQGAIYPIHEVEIYDPAKGQVVSVAPIPTPRFGATACEVGGKILVIGGVDGMGKAMNTIEAYDPALDTWETQPGLKTPRAHAVAGKLGNQLFVAGGHDGLIHLYNISPFDSIEALNY